MASRIVCMLLAHTETDIALETYKVVHKTIICFLGPEQAVKILDPTVQLSFILTPTVCTEIVCHGTTHVDTQVFLIFIVSFDEYFCSNCNECIQ